MRGGQNQYAPLPCVPALREAVLDHQRSWYGLRPEDVLVTFGATEGIAAALLGLCDPSDEVVALEPYYDSYAACIYFAGAARRAVTLRPPGFEVRAEALSAAIGPRARVLLLNSPHNPTGRVLSRAELGLVAGATRRPVTLRPPSFEVSAEALLAAITPRARVLLLNTPTTRPAAC